jgi:hypothetical protein
MSHELDARMTVRMTTDLYEWLKSDAEKELRSLNAQVLAILENYRKQKEKAENKNQ